MVDRIVAILAGFVLTAHAALATDVIYGCANKKTGHIRSVALSTPKCSANDTLVSWNQMGHRARRATRAILVFRDRRERRWSSRTPPVRSSARSPHFRASVKCLTTPSAQGPTIS